MMDLPYNRPRFPPFAITGLPSAAKLKRAISRAFVCYDQFCDELLQYQQRWTDWVFDHGFAEAIEDMALVFQIEPCLHGPRTGTLEVLRSCRTKVFIYTSYRRLRHFVENQCIAQPGDAVLACMIPPYVSDLSLQEMSRAHNSFCPGSHTSIADVQCFIAIQLSSLFVEEGTCDVHGRNGLKTTCRFFRRPAECFSRYDIVAIGSVLFHNALHQPANYNEDLSCFDLRYDYQVFLHERDANDGVGHYPEGTPLPSVAIVGGGLSGLVAAAELLDAGVREIALFTPVDEVRSLGVSPMSNGDARQVLTSFGVMPISGNQVCLSYYLDKFRIPSSLRFPCAGNDHTALYFRKKRYEWPAGQAPPGEFQRISAGWEKLLYHGCERNGRRLIAPMDIFSMLRGRRYEEASEARRAWLREFDNFTFHAALVEIFSCGVESPGGAAWQTTDFAAFGMMRLGGGRVSSCYTLLFSTVLDWIINGYEEDQYISVGGVHLLQALMRIEIFKRKVGFHFDPLRGLAKEGGKVKVCMKDGRSRVFDQVIIGGRGGPDATNITPVSHVTCVGYDIEAPAGNSSATVNAALFMITKQKFWLDDDIPALIWTDGLVRELCCIDIESPSGEGLVIFHYEMNDYLSRPFQSDEKKRRCLDLVRELAAVFPELACHLVPVNEDYEEYVFDGHLKDGFRASLWRENSLKKCQYSQDPHMYDSPLMEHGAVCQIDSKDCVNGALFEEQVKTGIITACTVIRSTGGTLSSLHPLDWNKIYFPA
ncbi:MULTISPECIES: FAD-dependent oxidoreductase [Rhizobium/Agrobacterium group]|nr:MULTISPECIES: FAD-dependent oxidoreductase [Rhizobium/Agrobacterium group]MCZ7445549.1 FAD-dependent oxidoreductase [Rhizobium rhizogenes]MCZ7472505.1 FAD-dependent oxidoreductase [Rhizobium rhizogenes]MCZ7502356.1 FAD-dependent oxidoreductase [Rhizobium rhizogenes]MCZ7854360.1 FAD-dependent oxidoreductase [Agrobacterium salinitolerans]MCZ7859316.1 FAD-dependent oxidoreductase [Agrobacterium salinitolerans]